MTDGAYAAVDLGAESGRVVLGRVEGSRASLQVAHRFENRPLRLPDGRHWNVLELFRESLEGLAHAAGHTNLRGIGVDTWGVDYALLDGEGRMLGVPFHYRDRRTEGMIEVARQRIPAHDLYAVTGIQTMPINTVFQLLAEEDSPALGAAERLVLIPDLLNFWLTGTLVNESTAASTTGLLDARKGVWARSLIGRLGLPEMPFREDPVEPGSPLGEARVDIEGVGGTPVHIAAGHDTASAFAAAPMTSPNAAVLSSGTWSLLGFELPEPILSEQARRYNLTNERGIDGTTRLLRNVMGLWLLQECRRHWQLAGQPSDYDVLHRLAAQVRPDVPLFDPDLDALIAPDDMPARIAAACRTAGQEPPADQGECVRSILVSLACKYRRVLGRLEQVTGRDADVVHVIGGGARNALLCQLTADMLGRPVLAGPVEATALGNILVQARSAGELGSLAELREVAAATARPVTYEPRRDRAEVDGVYQRFVDVTRSSADDQEPALT